MNCKKCGENNKNHCTDCDKKRKNKRAAQRRKAREDAMRSLGLVKVRGALGGTYWE